MSLAEGVFLHSWLPEWRHFFKGAGGIILKQQFPFLWVKEQRKKFFEKASVMFMKTGGAIEPKSPLEIIEPGGLWWYWWWYNSKADSDINDESNWKISAGKSLSLDT